MDVIVSHTGLRYGRSCGTGLLWQREFSDRTLLLFKSGLGQETLCVSEQTCGKGVSVKPAVCTGCQLWATAPPARWHTCIQDRADILGQPSIHVLP
jgi:hypothetical protein